MKQLNFATLNFAAKKKRMRREEFLDEMEQMMLRSTLAGSVARDYSVKGHLGWPPMPAITILSIRFMQQWHALRDLAMKYALYEIKSVRLFASLESNEDAIPDEKTILKLHRFPEQCGLVKKIFETVSVHLVNKNLRRQSDCWR